MTGEPTGNYMWSQYYDSTPVEVGKDGLEISIPIMQYTIESTPGTYDVPLKVAYNEADTANILVRFIVTNAPYLMADKPELRIENAESDFVGIDSVTITNAGQYKLTYELRLDPTGKGEEIIVDEGSNPGIAPMMAPVTLSAEAEATLRLNLKESMQAFEVSSDSLNAYDAPINFDYNRVMYYPSISTSPSYTYGTGDAFGQYISATHYVAPEDGFNISHVYIATTLTCEDGTKVNNVDYTVEIVNGADYENGDVLGKGTFHIDDMDGAKFVVIPLDRAVYMNPGQEFYVRVTYPVGIEWPAYLSVKQESVVNNRYMGYVEGYGWFDIASMFKNQYGSLGYIMSCLETVPGAPWVKMLNPDSEKVGELQPGESLNVKFEFNAAEAPLDKGNKAVLVVKSNDLYNPVLNFPITLDKNAAPVITVPTENILAKEATTTLVEVTINEPENDDLEGRRIMKGTQPGERFRNVYPLKVSETVYEGLRKDDPNRRGMIFTRSGFSGIQRYGSVMWSGDVGNDWKTLRYQISSGLNFVATGIPWWTYDAGGFFRPGDQHTNADYIERMIRWIQAGTFLPLMRVHGYMSDTEPWRYGKDAQRIITDYIRLRYRLLPYIYSEMAKVSMEGSTLMRPLVFDFPTDVTALEQLNEYMFGTSLLVNPVTDKGVNSWKTYLPEYNPGWYDFWSGEKYTGKQWINVPLDIEKTPVFVKAGTILPMGEVKQYVAEKKDAPITFTVYPGADASFRLYEDEGNNYNYESGAYSIVDFNWDDNKKRLTIGNREGAFDGMVNERQFVIKMGDKEKSVVYNGKKTSINFN